MDFRVVGPTWIVGSTIFEMWLGSLQIHRVPRLVHCDAVGRSNARIVTAPVSLTPVASPSF